MAIPSGCNKSKSFPDHPEQIVSDDSLERRLKTSFEDGLQLHPLVDLSKAWEKDLLGKLYSNSRSPYILSISHFSSSPP